MGESRYYAALKPIQLPYFLKPKDSANSAPFWALAPDLQEKIISCSAVGIFLRYLDSNAAVGIFRASLSEPTRKMELFSWGAVLANKEGE